MQDRQTDISSLGGFGLQRVLVDLDQLRERGRIRGGEVRQYLAVKRDLGRLQPFYETAVSGAGGAGGGVDANLPERPVVALLGLPVAEGIGAAVIHGSGGIPVKFGTAHPVAFGGCYHPFAAFAGSGGVSYAHGLVKS